MKPHITEETRLRAERLLDLMRKRGPRRPIVTALARELAAHDETLLLRAVVRIERDLASALSAPELDLLGPFSDVVMAIDRRALHAARKEMTRSTGPRPVRARQKRKTA